MILDCFKKVSSAALSVCNLIGLSGFDSTGLGLVRQRDTMDQQGDPIWGNLLAPTIWRIERV